MDQQANDTADPAAGAASGGLVLGIAGLALGIAAAVAAVLRRRASGDADTRA